MIKVSDFIASYLAQHEHTAKDIFMVSGGGNMHLIDSIGKEKKLNYVCNHHEQACAMAAEGYARVSNKIGVAIVTTGPGGTNAITGVLGAWTDSMPMLIISGQVKFLTTISSQPELQLRQLGDQEINIVDIVKPITKMAEMVTDKNKIKYLLQKALYLAKNGRPGPVWLDIPLDIQGALINEADLEEFIPEETPFYDAQITRVIEALKIAQRPVFIAGNGITLSDANTDFLALVDKLKIPVIATFARCDILKEDHPFYCGRYGTIGHRAANFAVQNSDLVIAIGARLNIRAISYNWEYFARAAKRIVVDIDNNELNKHTLEIDIKIQSDAKYFIQELLKTEVSKIYTDWIAQCNRYKNSYPTLVENRKNIEGFVDSYFFLDELSKWTAPNMIYVFGNGTASVSAYQCLKLYGQQRALMNSGTASMGYDLPAAIGACYALGKEEVICITGDGSLQMNIQELQTIIHYQLPIKIFVLNNDGYVSIRNTQNNIFAGHLVGADKTSGVSCPDTLKIAQAYGFNTFKIASQKNLAEDLKQILNYPGALICEVMLNPAEKMEPKLSSELKADGTMVSKPLEDMFPFLPRDEFKENMLIPTLPASE
jgi:acetolactate synthase-1/2/3 large subunit